MARLLLRRKELAIGGALLVQALLLGSSSNEPHKGLWPPNWRDYTGLFLSTASLFIAAGGGIGGGALLVPLNIVILGTVGRRATT
jgi:hypothetical protein